MSAVPKRRCGLRVEPYQAALCCAHTALQQMPLRCNCRWSDAAGRCIAAGCAAMQPAPLCPVGPTLGVLKGVATGCAAMQQAIMLRSNRPCSVAVAAARRCVWVCGRAQAGIRPTLVGNGRSGNAPEWEAPKRERARLSGNARPSGLAAPLLRLEHCQWHTRACVCGSTYAGIRP